MEEEEIEVLICHLGMDYFFIRVIKQPICPLTMMIILVLWNRKFHYHKEQSLESAMGKHKFEVVLSFGTNKMKSKTKDRCGDPTWDVRSYSFFDVYVHHNVGNQERRTCLDD